MIRRSSLQALFLCAAIIAVLRPAMMAAEAPNLYAEFLQASRNAVLLGNDGTTADADPVVQEFAAATVQLGDGEGKLLPEDIPKALGGKPDFCDPGEAHVALDPIGRCTVVRQEVQSIATREMRVRTLAKELTFIAAGYEENTLAYGDVSLQTGLRAQALMRLWSAGSGEETTGDEVGGDEVGVNLHTYAMPRDGELGRAIQDLGVTLEQLLRSNNDALTVAEQPPLVEDDYDELAAAVHRYRFAGARFLNGERPDLGYPMQADGSEAFSERRLTMRRWTEIEQALQSIWTIVNNHNLEREPGSGDAILVTFPDDFQEVLPESIRVWAYIEEGPDGRTGDIGLYSLFPMTSPPSICSRFVEDDSCAPILGGSYPPPPEDGNELCTQPSARQGYLCRPFTPSVGDTCANPVEAADGSIVLTSCQSQEGTQATTSGPNACQNIPWREEIPFDPQTQCNVEVKCDDNVPIPGGGVTTIKGEDGTIEIRIANNTQMPAAHLILHELQHAQQFCGRAPGTVPQPPPEASDSPQERWQKRLNCCAYEGDANALQCDAAEQDGLFESGAQSTTGIPFNAETCKQLLTDYSCRERGYGSCPDSFGYNNLSDDEELAFNEELVEYLVNRGREKGLSVSCQDTLEPAAPAQVDPRIEAMKNDIKMVGRGVSTSGTETTYLNTIGNNLCYLGQSLEEHLGRIAPGDTAFTVQGGASPVLACVREDPRLGTLGTVPSNRPWVPPPYRPAEMYRQLDAAACAGMAPNMTPAYCMFNSIDALRVAGIVGPATSAITQANERFRSMRDIEEITDALGARIGTRILAEYLEQRSNIIGDLALRATELLENFTLADFPAAMCPLNDAGGDAFLQTELCVADPASSTP